MKKFNPAGFYDEAAAFYDDMIGFEKALENRKILLNKFITPDINTCADFGCGSGADTLALASYNLKVTGFDISKEMIKAARKNAFSRNIKAEFKVLALEKIGSSYKNAFDMAISTGNSLANLEPANLKKALRSFYLSLKPGGRLIIQILNYSRILKAQERIVNIAKKGDEYFIRFYDFNSGGVDFNILKFNALNPAERKLITSKIYPYTKEDMLSALQKAGFAGIKSYGDLKLSRFSKSNSPDLVLNCGKSA
jgi:SAM-dependent methyltransferase